MSNAKTRLSLTALEAREVPAIVVPDLSSKPDAPYTIYLDFDGQYVEDWGYWPVQHSPGQVPAFSLDADTKNTTYDEYVAMGRVWAYVTEDFAPFNVNVTTINPNPGGSPREGEGVRVIIGGSADDWLDEPAFGVAYLDDFFGDSAPKAFVFSEDIVESIGNNAWLPKVVGDVVSHEAGHTLGLEHQSKYVGAPGFYYRADEYRPSAVNAATGEYRGVLMGNSYDARSTWGNGHYDQGFLVQHPSTQNDMAILGEALGWRADEPTRNFGVVAPGRHAWAEGIIGKTSDTDSFQFFHGGGPLSIEVTTLGETSTGLPHAGNLDTRVTLFAVGTLGVTALATYNPATTLGVSVVTGLPGVGALYPSIGQFTGNYILQVGSAGQYGDVGQYTIRLRHSTTSINLPSVQTATIWVSTAMSDGSGGSGGASGALAVKATIPQQTSAALLAIGKDQAAITPVPIPPSRPIRLPVPIAAFDDFEIPPLHGVAV